MPASCGLSSRRLHRQPLTWWHLRHVRVRNGCLVCVLPDSRRLQTFVSDSARHHALRVVLSRMGRNSTGWALQRWRQAVQQETNLRAERDKASLEHQNDLLRREIEALQRELDRWTGVQAKQSRIARRIAALGMFRWL